MESPKDILINSFSDFWSGFASYLPKLLLALLLMMAGFILAWLFEIIAKKVMKLLMLDKIIERVGLKAMFDKAGLKVSFSRLMSGIVYWFVLIVFLASAVNVLGLTQLSVFMDNLVSYLPNVIAAVAILVIGILVGNLLYNVVKNSTQSANIGSSRFLGSLTKWSIFTFAFIAALVQLKVAPDLLTILFSGFVVMIALAGGIAFGLGGKDYAKEILDKIKR